MRPQITPVEREKGDGGESEPGPEGFVRTSRANILIALEAHLPAEVILKIRKGLEQLDHPGNRPA